MIVYRCKKKGIKNHDKDDIQTRKIYRKPNQQETGRMPRIDLRILSEQAVYNNAAGK